MPANPNKALVDEVANIIAGWSHLFVDPDVVFRMSESIIALVAERTKEATSEMFAEGLAHDDPKFAWAAMHRASPSGRQEDRNGE